MANNSTHQRSSPLHFLLWPLSPAQGHLNPMLALAENLLAEGCIITCVLTEGSHRAMLDAGTAAAAQSTGLHFVTIPDAVPGSKNGRTDMFAATFKAMEEQQGFLERLIERSKSSESPISCIISDLTLPWAQDVANKCNIPRAILLTSSAATLLIGRVAEAGRLYPGAPELKDLQQILHMRARPMIDLFPPEDPIEKEQLMPFFRRLDEPSHILINTFGALEGHLLPLLPPNVQFIGPCLPHNTFNSTTLAAPDLVNGHSQQYHHENPSALRFGSMTKEDMTCLSWLDMQEDCSVLFISFGSVSSPPHAQIVEIALGVEASNHKFIWVARQENTLNVSSSSAFPEGFLERTKDRGLVISWAPQLQVLKHRAIGGFLTHCGWNSTLESIVMGVPMLCFPMVADQPIVAEIIMMGAPHDGDNCGEANAYGLGLGFEGRQMAGVKSNYMVSKEEVNEVVRALLGGDVGVKLRKNAHQLKDHARSALVGSSHTNLCSFIDDIRRATCP